MKVVHLMRSHKISSLQLVFVLHDLSLVQIIYLLQIRLLFMFIFLIILIIKSLQEKYSCYDFIFRLKYINLISHCRDFNALSRS